MVAVTKIGRLLKQLKQLETFHRRDEKALFNIFKTLTDGAGKPSPVVLEGKYLEELPIGLKPLISGLKKPKVLIGTKSSTKGQGILGIAIKDGNKTKGRVALGFDQTKGELPVIQLRGSLKNAEETFLSFNSLHNPNIPLNPENAGIFTVKTQGGRRLSTKITGENMTPVFMADSYINPELAKAEGIPSAALKELTAHQKLKPEDINKKRLNLSSFIKNKGHKIYSINDCIDDIVKIAQWKEKPTLESVKKAKDILSKKMGYDPSKINIKIKNSGNMAFNGITGDISVAEAFLQNAAFQDIAFALSHELTHMEDFVKLYKKLGGERFEKLIRPAKLAPEDIPPLNHNWYKEMSKSVDADNWKWNTGLQKTVIKDRNGNVIEKINHQSFNANTMIREFHDKLKLQKQNYKGKYAFVKDAERYQFSPIEQHARLVEKNLQRTLEERGLLQKTKYSDNYGKGPVDGFGFNKSRFKSIDEALDKLGGKRDEKFNELYYKALEGYDKRLAELCQKFDTDGLSIKDFDEIQELIEMQYLIEKHFGSQFAMEKQLVSNIAVKLGVTLT